MNIEALQVIERGCPAPPSTSLAHLGGKAFHLMQLAAEDFPVPPAFVLPAGLCASWSPSMPQKVFQALVDPALMRLERASQLRFADFNRPLLVSVRSGAAQSMPGMLDTVLNVGLNGALLPGLSALTGNPHLAWECYARLIESFAATVAKLDPAPFAALKARQFAAREARNYAELDTLGMREVALGFLDLYGELSGGQFPDDPMLQLQKSVDAVFASWQSEKAQTYRRIHGLDKGLGTAVTVQRMVYGNGGPRSGAGVGFSRNPATGNKGLYLDFAFNAQGEDVVAGRSTLTDSTMLGRLMPEVLQKLMQFAERLEQVFKDAQDFEFTLEQGELFLLQTRNAKTSPWARLKITVDLVHEGLIDRKEGLRRLGGLDLNGLVRRRVKGGATTLLAKGIAASIGAVSGFVVLSPEAARAAPKDKKLVLVRQDISTEDIDAIARAEGILTARGGRTSHAAVVARELGKVAIVGCKDLAIAADGESFVLGKRRLSGGAELTLDGESGEIHVGHVAIEEERPDSELREISGWNIPASAGPSASGIGR